jgi:hypothetical protein
MCVRFEVAEEMVRPPQYDNQQCPGWSSEAQRLLFGATRPKPESAGKQQYENPPNSQMAPLTGAPIDHRGNS